MVQKKTNCFAVNSGNSMKKYYMKRFCQIAPRTAHVIKSLRNIPFRKPENNTLTWEVDVAEEYFDDGNLTVCKVEQLMPFIGNTEFYSLNKKKRWLLEDVIGSAVYHPHLQKESFKVTFVHRKVAGTGIEIACKNYNNVVRYYDSHSSIPFVESSGKRGSLRQNLILKGNSEQEKLPSKKYLNRQKRKQNHNCPYRHDIQRKSQRMQKKGSRETRISVMNDDHIHVPEIRYEVGDVEDINSKSVGCQSKKSLHFDFQLGVYHTDNYMIRNTHPGTSIRFRGTGRERISWYLPEYEILSQKTSLAASTVVDDISDCEEYEADEGMLWKAPPFRREYSLLDFVAGAKSKIQQRVSSGRRAVSSASDLSVRNYGKGEAVYVTVESEAEKSKDVDRFVSEVGNTIPDEAEDDSGVASEDVSNNTTQEITSSSSPSLDYEEEFSQFDDSFCSCAIPYSELKVNHLKEIFGTALQIGKCVPFTVKFDVRAVAVMSGEKQKDEEELSVSPVEWWLLCQTADMTMINNLPEPDMYGVSIVKLRLHSSHDGCEAANEKLRQLVTNENGQSVAMCLSTLLLRICSMLNQLSGSSWISSSKTPEPVQNRSCSKLEAYLPHEQFTERIEISNVTDAYHQLKSTYQTTPQDAENEDANLSCCLAGNKVECSVCFMRIEDSKESKEGFRFFVTLTACGHSYCRRCWQHHLLSRILEGETSLHCMEYKCETTVDCATLMSLVPQWAYTKWLERMRSKAVERSGMWNWCPNACCGLLARTQTLKLDKRLGNLMINVRERLPYGRCIRCRRLFEKINPLKFGVGLPMWRETRRGVPVVCQCHRRWCLNCKGDAHWPLSCTLFAAYNKMLRQYGDEDGKKISPEENMHVNVKRCPECCYPIEKSGGCHQMSCSMCSKQFCWTCLQDISTHHMSPLSCQKKEEEIIHFSNENAYSVPIQCYKKAVSYRYVWKGLDRNHFKTINACRNIAASMSRKDKRMVNNVPDAINHVIEGLIFLKKSNMLLEMCYVLLSNFPRHHQMARSLKTELTLLEFNTRRVEQMLTQPKQRLLNTVHALHLLTSNGNRQTHRACYIAHRLASRQEVQSQVKIKSYVFQE